MSKKNNKKQNVGNKLTKRQRKEKAEAERLKREAAERKRQRKGTMKKVGIVLVCVILAVALGIPAVAFQLLGHGI